MHETNNELSGEAEISTALLVGLHRLCVRVDVANGLSCMSQTARAHVHPIQDRNGDVPTTQCVDVSAPQ